MYLLLFQVGIAKIVSGLIVKNPVLNKYGMEMMWVDGRDRLDDPITVDTLFDRCVCISQILDRDVIGRHHYKYFNHEVTGVFITEWLVLTTFNPFRNIVPNNTLLKTFRVKSINGRYVRNASRGAWSYLRHPDNIHPITCARQVVPPFELETQPLDMRHGANSPLHDLMVIRIAKKLKFLDPIPEPRYHFNDFQTTGYWEKRQKAFLTKGYAPIKTELARRGDILEKDIKFASIAHLNDIHIFENRFLEMGKLSKEMITDCDDWIPREWGHFICLKNVNNYEGMASGAVLFGGLKLFGLGAFALWKGMDKAQGILVFTDIRPYVDLVYKTCRWDDQNLKYPEETTSTTPARP